VLLSVDGGTDGADGFAAVVEIIDLLGPRAIVALKARSTSLTAVVEAAGLSGITEGAHVQVYLRTSKLHLFGSAGLRL
jgi:multiple sugar transport system ATP-binding protein